MLDFTLAIATNGTRALTGDVDELLRLASQGAMSLKEIHTAMQIDRLRDDAEAAVGQRNSGCITPKCLQFESLKYVTKDDQ